MLINLNKREVKKIIHAIDIAIMSERSFIDAHNIGLRMIKGHVVGYIPKEFLPIVNRTKTFIKGWMGIRSKLRDEL